MCKLAFKCYTNQNNGLLLYDDPIAVSVSAHWTKRNFFNSAQLWLLCVSVVVMRKDGALTRFIEGWSISGTWADIIWVSVAPTVSYSTSWPSKPRGSCRDLTVFHCSHRHTEFPNPLARNISWLFRERAFPCSYICVDLWGMRNDRAELLGQLFKGKWEFMFFSHLPVLSPTYIQQHK